MGYIMSLADWTQALSLFNCLEVKIIRLSYSIEANMIIMLVVSTAL